MKRFFTIMLGVLLIAAITAPAFAWEFAMTGEAEFRYMYFARQGSDDLFGGPAGYFAGAPTGTIGFAGPVGAPAAFGGSAVLVQGFSAKGADASISDNRIWLFPEIRVNPAIRFRGEYWVTGTNLRGNYAEPGNGWSSPFGYVGWYIEQDGHTGNRVQPSGMSVGQWEKFWVTAQLPWGILAVGRRPFAFGTGWSAAHEKDADSESWFLGAPYGPLTFGLYTHTRVVGGDPFAENSAALLAGAPVTLAMGTDKNRARQDFGEFFTYNNGPVSLGMFQQWVLYKDQHFLPNPAGPAARDDFSQAALVAVFLGAPHLNGGPMYGDVNFVFGINYFKYNNGKFFLNAEYDYQYADVSRKGGRPSGMWGEAWQLELGTMCGPAKVSLAAFRSSGQDRRGGLFNVTNATGWNAGAGTYTYDQRTDFLAFSGREQALLPYVWLLGIYGGGNNSYDNRGKPGWADLMAYAARLDYAVAANLNVYGTFFYANRDSNTGTSIGQYAGGAAPRVINPAITANVPDNYLGWEADVGVDWKLLEGLTVTQRFAYWQPGDWFKWAYQDYGSLAITNVGGAAYSVNPSRGIDPLIGYTGSVVVDF